MVRKSAWSSQVDFPSIIWEQAEEEKKREEEEKVQMKMSWKEKQNW